MTAPTQDLEVLFPLPSSPPSAISPTAPAGITHDSAEALVRLLKENHVKFHCFWNDQGFHNHLSHHLFAAYHLGASPELLQSAFDSHAHYLRPAYTSPSAINTENWSDHLGDADYYDSYLGFFSAELVNNGLDSTLESFLFSVDANWGNNVQDKHPEMLSRLLAGLVHPFIYLGHGVEFGQLGMVAEGLAQAAVHSVPTSVLLSREVLMPSPLATSIANGFALNLSFTSTARQKRPGAHPFSLLARILKDPRLAPESSGEDTGMYYENTIKSRGDVIREYAQAWDADVSTHTALGHRMEEIAWIVTLIYAVGGWRKNRPFKADFFTMHLVTSSIFLPSVLAHLSCNSKRILLRSYFAVILGYWVSQGRAQLHIEAFYTGTVSNSVAPGPQPTPHPETLDKENLTPNPWYPLLQSTLMHPGEHLLKLERALAHYAVLYGVSPKGRFSDTELEGAETLDGTVFLRAAWLSLNRNGWMREGDEKGDWDFDGFFEDY